MRGIDFGVCKRPLRVPVSEGVSHTLLTWGNILAAEHVEEFHPRQVRRLGLLYHLQDPLVGSSVRQYHRHVTADRREGRERPEGLAGISACEEGVQVKLGQQDGVT